MMEVKLEVIKGPERGNVFVLNEATTCLAGRSSDARFRFSEEDPYISRRHFLLEVAPPNVYFRDLDVTNPSKINDLYVEEAILADGDIIEVGFTKLKVSLKPEGIKRKFTCKECGKKFEIDDETPVQICTDCAEKQEQRTSKPTKDKTPLKITCECGKDLTKRADSDGRARELLGKVTYCCDRCLREKREDVERKINDYMVIKKLGEGGMGKVYLAYHKPTARLVALKEMNILNKELAARFNRERRHMKKMNHENVITYIDEGQDKKTNKPFLVMEYAPEGSLEHQVAANKGPLNPTAAVNYIIGALKGLEYIHHNGIVHRDIKPENIFLTSQDNGNGKGKEQLVTKIADFGLSRQFSRAGGSCLTKMGQGLGTILFMPPEQVRDAHSVREPADLYAMGVTLYYLLTGKYTFDFPSPVDVLKFLYDNKQGIKTPEAALKFMMEADKLNIPHSIVLSEEPTPIRERKPTIPAKLANIVDKSVKKDIRQRFQRAEHFRNQLELTARGL